MMDSPILNSSKGVILNKKHKNNQNNLLKNVDYKFDKIKKIKINNNNHRKSVNVFVENNQQNYLFRNEYNIKLRNRSKMPTNHALDAVKLPSSCKNNKDLINNYKNLNSEKHLNNHNFLNLMQRKQKTEKFKRTSFDIANNEEKEERKKVKKKISKDYFRRLSVPNIIKIKPIKHSKYSKDVNENLNIKSDDISSIKASVSSFIKSDNEYIKNRRSKSNFKKSKFKKPKLQSNTQNLRNLQNPRVEEEEEKMTCISKISNFLCCLFE